MGRPPVYIKASPRPTYIIARVMIKGGMPPRLMPRPLVSPAAVPIPSPTTINAKMPKRWKDATKTTTSPTIDPTERSMPAVMITKVMPRAMMPVMEICLSTFKIFVGRRNTGERNAATKTSMRNAMRTPYRSSAPVNETVPMRESAVGGFVSAEKPCSPNLSPFYQYINRFLVLCSLGAGKGSRNRPDLHHDNPVRHPQDLRDLRRDHQNGPPLGGEALHQAVNLHLGTNIDAPSGFVENEDATVGIEPLG